MKIAMSSGHGKYIRGARGNPVPPQLDEVDEARKVVERVADYFRGASIEVQTFHDDVSTTQSENLDRIVAWHNSQQRDLDISVHFNCYDHTAHGTEVLYVTQQGLSAKVSSAICAAGGFTNRGAKYRNDLAFLNGTEEPAILIETCFCDNTNDSNLYNEHFDAICRAIAESTSGADIPVPGPTPPELIPPQPIPPQPIPVKDRPTLEEGDSGPNVIDMQKLIPFFTGTVDGDFGPVTEDNVLCYQFSRGLDVDGICGQQTWTALYANASSVITPPAPPPNPLTPQQQTRIKEIANSSRIAAYSWQDRGRAPTGYTQGMALAFAQTYLKLKVDHPAAMEMAKARTSSSKDVFNVYKSDFDKLDMSNEDSGIDALRHLYALMLGSGMRESSGQYCCGRDQSASNTDSNTCEAGAFQTSYNANTASDPEFNMLLVEYGTGQSPGYIEAFSEDVTCSQSNWACYGSGTGLLFQRLSKLTPAFAVETHALTLRNLCNHYGPINRHEVELKKDANDMFQAVQSYVDTLEPGVA